MAAYIQGTIERNDKAQNVADRRIEVKFSAFAISHDSRIPQVQTSFSQIKIILAESINYIKKGINKKNLGIFGIYNPFLSC